MSSHPVEKSRRQYNSWVATETLEDYALRYSPAGFRKWSPLLLANTALGGISFLALEAIGAVLLLNFGYSNAFWAVCLASLIIFAAGLPISYYAARYNIDIDLLTRSAGFGYIGSTITSLIYASFCFIFFALEAAIMAQALKLYLDLPLYLGYILCSLVIVPIVFYGVTAINRLHQWTQPLWLVLMLLPFYFVLTREPHALDFLLSYQGAISGSNTFDLYHFGIATGISFALIAQIGEQVDYLRFMPDKTASNRWIWWFSLLTAGPGWVVLGFFKQLGGMLLASIAVFSGLAVVEAKEPVQMYDIAYTYVFAHPGLALSVSTLFVVLSQIKINVTNAYAGSLAWSNFFSRVSHSHPGRVVWLVFNIGIALLLMELGVFDAMQKVLGLYSNVAIAWIAAVVADLVINKPMGLSPPVVEFKRAHLYDYNPVGFVSMSVASVLSIVAFTGLFGRYAQAYSWLIALMVSFMLSPLIAIWTKGKYYIARQNVHYVNSDQLSLCGVCDQYYAQTDFAYCPYHEKPICALCCTLDSGCKDQCKPRNVSFYRQTIVDLLVFFSRRVVSPQAIFRVAQFTLIAGLMLGVTAVTFWLSYSLSVEDVNGAGATEHAAILYKLYIVLAVFIVIAAWWVVLVQEAQALSETELHEQNEALLYEINERHKTEAMLKNSEQRFRDVSEAAGEYIWEVDENLVFTYVSNQSENVKGYTPEELLGHTPLEFMPAEDVLAVQEIVRNALEKQIPFRLQHRDITPSGEVRWEEVNGLPCFGENGSKLVGLRGTGLDITERKQAQMYEQFRSNMLELLTGSESLGGVLTAIVTGVERLKPAMLCSVLLVDRENNRLVGSSAPSLPESVTSVMNDMEIAIGDGSCGAAVVTGERVIVENIQTHVDCDDYKEIAARAGLSSCWSQPVKSGSGKVLAVFSVYQRQPGVPTESDIYLIEQAAHLCSIAIERKYAENEIHNLAFYDVLTGLPNRRLLMDRLNSALILSARTECYGALLFLDMDRFKILNDTLGHDYGDLMLIEVASRIRSCLREVDSVARLGGDEFVVLLEEIDRNDEVASQKVAQIAEKIRISLSTPYCLQGNVHNSSPSIGVCLYSGHTETPESLLKHADMAMYQVKESGRNAVQFFDAVMQHAVETRSRMEADLRFAVPGRQLHLYYQIQVDSEHRPIGAEALVRWLHPQRGTVMPKQFIPIAEESALILDVGEWVLNSACRQLALWALSGQTRHLTLAVNVSANQFKRHDFVELVASMLDVHKVDAARLKLELTESVVLNDVAEVIEKMHVLKKLGISLSMDDFGTGYSSLSYLKQLPLDQIKIDQSFVRDMTFDENDAVMVQTIIDMAKNFGLDVIAEGVETESQLQILKQLGCMSYQGYYFGEPVPVELLNDYLKKGNRETGDRPRFRL